jgi:hypothetical protein
VRQVGYLPESLPMFRNKMTLEDRPYMLLRNVGKELPLYAA